MSSELFWCGHKAGYEGVSMDYDYDNQTQDMRTAPGFLFLGLAGLVCVHFLQFQTCSDFLLADAWPRLVVSQLMRIKPRGFFMMALLCNSFSAMPLVV